MSAIRLSQRNLVGTNAKGLQRKTDGRRERERTAKQLRVDGAAQGIQPAIVGAGTNEKTSIMEAIIL